MLTDEVASLKYMSALDSAKDTHRKYSAHLICIFQSEGQLDGMWGKDGARSWRDSAMFRVYASIGDPDTLKSVSAACGKQTLIAESKTTGSGTSSKSGEILATGLSQNEGRSESSVGTDLIRPEEISLMRADEEILFIKHQKPIRCGRAMWFRRPEMVALIEGRF